MHSRIAGATEVHTITGLPDQILEMLEKPFSSDRGAVERINVIHGIEFTGGIGALAVAHSDAVGWRSKIISDQAGLT